MWRNNSAALSIRGGARKIHQALPGLKRAQSSLKGYLIMLAGVCGAQTLHSPTVKPQPSLIFQSNCKFPTSLSTMTPSLLRATLRRGWTLSWASQTNLVTVEEWSGSLLGGLRSSPISSLISLWSSSLFLPNWILQERCPSAADLSYPEIGGD